MKIIKVYKETMPETRLIGRRYTDLDRDENGTFAHFWRQWMSENLFDKLQSCTPITSVSDDYLGAMRITEGGFEYWIGRLFAPDSQIPGEFDFADIPAGELGVCWLSGDEQSGELFGMEASERALSAMADAGFNVTETGWFFERYNESRYTKPDENGHVILDICAYLL